ncbi:hypothetical protein HH682_06570 [Rosenbergiella sp. S61]|uniref:Uncharacterized protein n=1 Tax=Rosenbergiella gaditana TaxID=2726987 RepID=A0ABS5SZA7_9GAMM|nr:hypothetical protein [Rosenbergiella gaditana]
MPGTELETYCELIPALKLRTTNKKGRHLSTARAIALIEDYGVETPRGFIHVPQGPLTSSTVERHLTMMKLDHLRFSESQPPSGFRHLTAMIAGNLICLPRIQTTGSLRIPGAADNDLSGQCPVAKSQLFQNEMPALGIDWKTHLLASSDGTRTTARSKGKVERPFRTVKEAHDTLYHFTSRRQNIRPIPIQNESGSVNYWHFSKSANVPWYCLLMKLMT